MAEYLGLDRSSVSRIENGAEISGPVAKLLDLLEGEAAPVGKAAIQPGAVA